MGGRTNFIKVLQTYSPSHSVAVHSSFIEESAFPYDTKLLSTAPVGNRVLLIVERI